MVNNLKYYIKNSTKTLEYINKTNKKLIIK